MCLCSRRKQPWKTKVMLYRFAAIVPHVDFAVVREEEEGRRRREAAEAPHVLLFIADERRRRYVVEVEPSSAQQHLYHSVSKAISAREESSIRFGKLKKPTRMVAGPIIHNYSQEKAEGDARTNKC